MDVNLTGQIAANLVEILKPPWYNPLLNAGAGVIGGIVTGGTALLALWISKRNEAKRIRRDERKKAYLDFIYYAHMLNAGSTEPTDYFNFGKSLNAILVLGSLKVITEISRIKISAANSGDLAKVLPILLRLKAEEIQGFDVYASLLPNQEAAKSKSWWQFWR